MAFRAVMGQVMRSAYLCYRRALGCGVSKVSLAYLRAAAVAERRLRP